MIQSSMNMVYLISFKLILHVLSFIIFFLTALHILFRVMSRCVVFIVVVTVVTVFSHHIFSVICCWLLISEMEGYAHLSNHTPSKYQRCRKPIN